METIIFLIGVTAIMVLLSLTAFVLGWLFTEVIKHPLRFKPFNCRPCFSFWLTVVLYSVYAWVIAPYFISNGLVVDRFTLIYGITGVGVLAGLVTFLYIKSKFTIYE